MKVKNKPYNLISKKDREDIKRMYYEKVSFKGIQEALEISDRAIRRSLKDDGINTSLKNRYTLNENYFEIIDTEKRAYLLGLLYADGFIGNEKINNVSISFIEDDLHILESFKEEIEFTGDIRKSKSSGSFPGSSLKDKYVLNFSSKVMCDDLRKLGMFTAKSMSLTDFPAIEDHLIRHFIRGYFDGDGSISFAYREEKYGKNKDGSERVYTYPRCRVNIIGTEKFVRTIGSYVPTPKISIRDSVTPDMKYLNYSGKGQIISLYHYLYDDSNMYMFRKFNKWQETMSAFGEI